MYHVVLLRRFFDYYRKDEPKFEWDPFLDFPLSDATRVRLHKRPRKMNDPRMRKNLFDFINQWMSPVPNRLENEIKKTSHNGALDENDPRVALVRTLSEEIVKCFVGLSAKSVFLSEK